VLSPDEFRKKKADDAARKKARKMELAADDNYGLIPRRAGGTNDFIALLAKNDYFINQLMQKLPVARKHKIDVADAMEVLADQQKIADAINIHNAAVCALLGMEYEPPRGYELKTKEPQKQKPQQTGPRPVAAVAGAAATVESNTQETAAAGTEKPAVKAVKEPKVAKVHIGPAHDAGTESHAAAA
jgi:hypothetical protein